MQRLPLATARVLDLSLRGAAGYCARLLGDAGAEVIGVEGWNSESIDRTPAFDQLNRNKLACTLDPAQPEGPRLLLRLVARCDAAVAGLPLPAGLTEELLRFARADLALILVRDWQPAASALHPYDVVAGTIAAGAAFAALFERRNTGEGQRVEVDAADCVRSFRPYEGKKPLDEPSLRLPSQQAILADSDLHARGFFETVSSLQGTQEMPRTPWRLSRTPMHVRLPAPSPGEHNRYVFGELLGLPNNGGAGKT